MKKRFLIMALTHVLWMANASARVDARLQVSKPTPFVKETFTITLEIVSRDIEIDPQLDLENVPSSEIIHILEPFEALAVQRERTDNQEITRRRYRAQARAIQPGKVDFAPVLQLTARQRVRTFFGSTMEVRPVRIQLPAITLDINPIPPPPDGFSGIIGDFQPSITAAPLAIAAGDLVTITTTLRGEGWATEETIPAIPAQPRLRAYRVRGMQGDDRPRTYAFTQTVVPLDADLSALPAITLVWFHTAEGRFRRDTFGPFPLHYVQAETDAMPVESTSMEQLPVPVPARQSQRLQLTEATRAHLAPATTSKSTFTIPAASSVRVLQIRDAWLLIDHEENRGWIPAP